MFAATLPIAARNRSIVYSEDFSQRYKHCFKQVKDKLSKNSSSELLLIFMNHNSLAVQICK